MQVKKQQLQLVMEQWNGSKLGKENEKGLLLLLICKYITGKAGLDESQAEIMIASGNINNFIYVEDDRKLRGTKETLDEGEGEECKSWPKPQH